MNESKNTKELLAQALKSLMARHPFSKISVGDICTECSMSRKSFYYHFQDKYDLVNWIFYTEFIDIFQQHMTDEKQMLISVCKYFCEEQIFYRNALGIRGQNCFHDYFVEVIQPFVRVMLQDLDEEDSNLDFYATFCTDAFLASLTRWLNEETVIPPERFAQLVNNLMFRMFK